MTDEPEITDDDLSPDPEGWDETAYLQASPANRERLDRATAELDGWCKEAE